MTLPASRRPPQAAAGFWRSKFGMWSEEKKQLNGGEYECDFYTKPSGSSNEVVLCGIKNAGHTTGAQRAGRAGPGRAGPAQGSAAAGDGGGRRERKVPVGALLTMLAGAPRSFGVREPKRGPRRRPGQRPAHPARVHPSRPPLPPAPPRRPSTRHPLRRRAL
jgi:hypothetical protein